MSARKSVIRFFAHAAMVVGAIFVVTVLLAAMPGHNPPSVEAVGLWQSQSSSQGSSATPPVPALDHSQMDMGEDKGGGQRNEPNAWEQRAPAYDGNARAEFGGPAARK